VGACTLLGPEGPGAGLFPFLLGSSPMPVLLAGWGGYRPYFENYTVDASIFEPTRKGWFGKDDLKDH
jgi:hypothetical protein